MICSVLIATLILYAIYSLGFTLTAVVYLALTTALRTWIQVGVEIIIISSFLFLFAYAYNIIIDMGKSIAVDVHTTSIITLRIHLTTALHSLTPRIVTLSHPHSPLPLIQMSLTLSPSTSQSPYHMSYACQWQVCRVLIIIHPSSTTNHSTIPPFRSISFHFTTIYTLSYLHISCMLV
jgi:hypothetical protein